MPPPDFEANRQSFTIDGRSHQRVTVAVCRIVRKEKSGARSVIPALVLVDQATKAVAPYPAHTVGGHLIGLKLGGPDTSENLVPMYAGFNGTTYKNVEKAIYEDVTISHMKVIVSYRCVPPNMPAQFTIFVKRRDLPFRLHAALPMMEEPAPIRYICTNPDSASGIVSFARGKIGGLEWNTFKASRPIFQGVRCGRYEFLDYLCLQQPDMYDQLCHDLGVINKGFTMRKGMGYQEAQINIIKKVNWLLNGDFVRSDHDGTLLLDGSSTLSPHIDHVLAKATASGPNLFSNARVTSAIQNMSKGTKRIADHAVVREVSAASSSSSSSSSSTTTSLAGSVSGAYDRNKRRKL